MTIRTLPARTQRPAAFPRARRALPALLAGAVLLGLSACMTSADKDPEPAPRTEKGFLFAVTADRSAGGTGNYSVYGIDSAFTRNNIAPIHSDAVARYLGGDDIFILNRMGRDNLQAIDRHHLENTVLQIAFPALSNPQDVALRDSLLYVAFWGLDKIGIYRQGDGTAAGEIDLSEYADSADGLPETAALMFVGGDLYALTQNLETKTTYAPLTAHLLRIDVGAKKVTKALELPYGNPQGLTWDSAAGRFYIPCLGAYGRKDGGILGIDVAGLTVADTVATELDLDGDVADALLHDGKLITLLSTGTADKILAISIAEGEAEKIVEFGAYSIGGMTLDRKTSTLFVGDRKKGEERLRIFDLGTYAEKEGSKVDLGMPPSNLVIVR